LERNCWYCHKPLPLTKLLKRNLFCSSEHEERYFDEQSTAAFERMKEPEPTQQPAVLELKPPEVEQAPAENHPPMAQYLKPEVFARETHRLAIAIEDPQHLPAELAEPAQRLSARWQIKLELAPAGRISEVSAVPSAMADMGGEFPSVPFAESKRDITGHIEQTRSANLFKSAQCVPAWDGRATGETAPNAISAEASSPTPLSPRTVAVETRLKGNLSSTAAACSWGLRTPQVAQFAPLAFESSPAFTSHGLQGGAGVWTPNPARPRAGGVLAKDLTIPHKDAVPPPALHTHSQESAMHFSKGGTLAGLETPALSPCAWIHGSRKNAGPAKADRIPGVAMSWTRESNPAVAIQPVDVPRTTCRLAAAPFHKIQTSSVQQRASDTIAPGELVSTGRIAISRLRHDGFLLFLRAWTRGAWEQTHPAGLREQREIDSIATAELTSTGRIAISRVRHDVPVSLPCKWTRGGWQDTHPAKSEPAPPPTDVWTSEHHAVVTIRPIGVPRSVCRPITGSLREILPGEVDCRWVASLKPHASHTFIRAADFRPAWADVLAGVAAVKFAGLTDVRRKMADSSGPGLVPAGRLEPIPVSVVADPNTVRPVAAVLRAGDRIDPRSRPIPAKTQPGTVPRLDRQTEIPCRIPLTEPGKLKSSTVRAGIAPAGGFAGGDDAATEPRVTPPIAIRVQPASLFASPAPPASVAFGWARRKLVSNPNEFLTQRSSVTAPLKPVPPASGGPARPALAVNRFPITRIPRSAPCFALDLRLQTVPYHRGGRIRL
jgi:hypothetical protein